MKLSLHHQNFMLAIRKEMGWPLHRPANDCIAFSAGLPTDLAVGTELARIATLVRKDLIYSGWASAKDTVPEGFTVVYRELLAVNVMDRVIPWAANETDPILFVSTRRDEFFAIDGRGSLARVPGKPMGLRKGNQLALKRIKSTAAEMGNVLLENNRCVRPGDGWIEPELPVEAIVQFG